MSCLFKGAPRPLGGAGPNREILLSDVDDVRGSEDRATQLAPMLSPRQLARLAVGFGEGQAGAALSHTHVEQDGQSLWLWQVKVKALWQSLTKEAAWRPWWTQIVWGSPACFEALARASAFSAPDMLRMLAGFDAASVQHPGQMQMQPDTEARASDSPACRFSEDVLDASYRQEGAFCCHGCSP